MSSSPFLLFLVVGACFSFGSGEECVKRTFDYDSFVCVCSELTCDTFPTVPDPGRGWYSVVTSSREGLRFHVETLPMVTSQAEEAVEIFIDYSDIRQTMLGFGGAFTDSAGINILSLSEPLQDLLIRQYFSAEGLEYNLGRIPIAGCDFSTYPYSYDDVEGDVELEFFSLTKEDYVYKIPLIKKAIEFSNKPIMLFGSPWSPPSWMKENGKFNGTGGILPEMLQPWANYFVKFLKAYESEGLKMWGLTAQNEPFAGKTPWMWNACHFTAEQQRDFVKFYLGPTLKKAGYGRLKLMIVDDNRHMLPDYALEILKDPAASQFVSGVGVHWYSDNLYPPSVLSAVHDQHPDKFILYTEACNGDVPLTVHVRLGDWKGAEAYVENVIEDVTHWSVGWTDWNLALDPIGGPNWASNFVDAPIIVNATANEFLKQPMFYGLAHFTKFVPQGSRALGGYVRCPVCGHTCPLRERGATKKDCGATKTSKAWDPIKSSRSGKFSAACFLDNDDRTVCVVLNKERKTLALTFHDSLGRSFSAVVPAKAFQTYVFRSAA